MGATVLPFVLDVTDASGMARTLDEIKARFGRLSGVVHAAGLPGGRLLMQPEAPDIGQVLAPKLAGTVNLLNLVAPQEPDFIMLCSSFASVGGGPGQGEYAAANAFLDAAAAYGRTVGMKTTSISWPAWRDVGMAHAMKLPDELKHLRDASLQSGIDPAEGAELFLRIVVTGVPHVVVAPKSAPARSQPRPQPAARQRAVDKAAAVVVKSPPREPVREDTDDIRSLLADKLSAIWTEVLGVRSVMPDDNFFEIGGQSLMALRIVVRLDELFGVEVSLDQVLQTPRFGDFCELVHRCVAEEIDAMPEEAVRQQLVVGGAA
jgi:acyl carrier protein